MRRARAGQGGGQADHGQHGRTVTQRFGEHTVRFGEFGQNVARQSGQLFAEDAWAVAIRFGKDDVDAQCQRLPGEDFLGQLGEQFARPWPLTMRSQALAVDTDDDDRFVVALPRHLPLIAVELGVAQAGQRRRLDILQRERRAEQQQDRQGQATAGPKQGGAGQAFHSVTVRPS